MQMSENGKSASENETTNQSSQQQFLLVGIGASAGGIQALKDFFEHVPANSDIAYVVILHLSPDYDSQLTAVLQTVCVLPVSKVTEKMHVEPNHVYVVPPNGSLKMAGRNIAVEQIHTIEERRAPIDIFFRTLADTTGPRAVAVVLSGTGADGSMGLKRVKENGGVVFVQNPREAEYSDMPRNAIATELVDEILNAAEIPNKIIAYKDHIGTVEIPITQEELEEKQQAALREIFTQLRIRTGHDFTNYKRATILRRIERRINVRGLYSLSEYAAFLRENPEETQALLKDLLISVTNFFRDKEAFAYLETHVIPNIVQQKTAENGVRAWVAGCATGEEAYSLAMLFHERLYNGNSVPPIQIFATDIDEAAIATAREGFYTLNDAADVSPDRLRRFFIPEAGGYRIKKELREMILFANHNVLKDAPFSKIDFISCRNMLIYLNGTAQNRVMETFHLALNPGGYLFLGSSESADGANDLFVVVNKEHNVFQSRHVTTRPIPVPDTSLPTAFHIKLPEQESKSVKATAEQENRVLTRISLADLHLRMLEQYAPPSLVINENHEVVHVSESAGQFLQVTGGEPSTNIFKMIKQELRPKLRTALYQAEQKRVNIEVKNLPVIADSETKIINLHVRPVFRKNDTARGFILIVFEPLDEKAVNNVVEVFTAAAEPVTLHLEEELTSLKNQLRLTNEQFEVQTEELKASNEELQAMNEELRSTTEELETSKEELQSINEELITVNQELKIKIEEVSQSNNDFLNLINSIDIGTVFLDRDFRVKLFTPAAREIFNLIQADIGRQLSDITSRLEYDDLLKDAETVLQKLQSVEHEVHTTDGRSYLMQIQPYRTAEDRIKGIVIVFINITQRRQAEEAKRATDERMHLIVESTKDYAIFTFSFSRCIDSWNTGAQAMFGYTEEEIIGKSGDILFTPEDREKGAPEYEAKKAQGTGRAENERWHLRKDGSRFYGSGVVAPLRDEAGNVIGFLKIMRDLTQQKHAEEALRTSEENLRLAIEAGNIGTCDWNYQAGEMHWNDIRFRMYGMEPVDKTMCVEELAQIIHPDDRAQAMGKMKTGIETTGTHTEEYRVVHPNGEVHWIMETGRVVEWQDSNPLRVISVLFDLTAQHQSQEALRESEERYRAIVSQTSVGIMRAEKNGLLVFLNEKSCAMLGLTPAEAAGKAIWEVTTPHDMEEQKRLYNRLVTEGLPFQYEKQLKRNNSTLFWASVSVAPIKDAHGKTQSAVAVVMDITGRKQAEEALRETMERFQYALRATKDVIWEIDYGKNHVWWSSMMQTLFGYSQYEVQHSIDWFQGLIHIDDRERVVKSFNEAVSGKEELWTDEFRYRQANGTYVYVMCRSYIIRNKEGKAIRMIGAMQDITERRKAEEAVRKSEERLRVTLESATDYVIITQNAEGIIEGWNSGAERIFGYKAAEVIGKPGNIIFTPEDQAAGAAKQEMEIARADGRAIDERWHLRKDGVRIFMSGVLAPIRNNNVVTGFVKVARDMTAQKQAEEALLAAQNSLNTALEAAKMGVWDMNFATGVMTRSAQHDQLLGYPTLQEEWSPEKAKRYMAEEDKAKFDEAYDNMISKGIFELEARVHHSNGNVCWVHYYGRVFKNEKGEPTHAAGVIFDITDRKSLEQKKDEFIGIASHELKTPVTSIKAYTEILYDQFVEAGDSESAIYLKKLNTQVDRLTHLIRDLLDATRISEGRLALNVSDVDINQLLRETTDELQNTAGKHAIKLNLQDIPSVQGDKERLQQVFVNLIANAIKYSPEANRVLVKTYQNNGNIHIEVQDFGIGMSPETQHKLFGRFFRSNDQNITTFPGLGLGLYISLQIVKQHKGTIKVQSEIGKGSVFTVVLPTVY